MKYVLNDPHKFMFVFLFTLSLFGYPKSSTGSSTRQYIIATSEINLLKTEVLRVGGNLSHDLRYHGGFVAQLSPEASLNLKQRFGYRALIEEDALVHSYPVAVINGKSAPIQQPPQTIPWGISAVIDAFSAGVIIVAAAGNEGTSVSYPAKYTEVLAISALDSFPRFAYFSNFGPEIDFIAPGVSVYSTYLNGGYATMSGTSMASPHVAGVAALMVASQSFGIMADDVSLSTEQQGAGLPNALSTVMNIYK